MNLLILFQLFICEFFFCEERLLMGSFKIIYRGENMFLDNEKKEITDSSKKK